MNYNHRAEKYPFPKTLRDQGSDGQTRWTRGDFCGWLGQRCCRAPHFSKDRRRHIEVWSAPDL